MYVIHKLKLFKKKHAFRTKDDFMKPTWEDALGFGDPPAGRNQTTTQKWKYVQGILMCVSPKKESVIGNVFWTIIFFWGVPPCSPWMFKQLSFPTQGKGGHHRKKLRTACLAVEVSSPWGPLSCWKNQNHPNPWIYRSNNHPPRPT